MDRLRRFRVGDHPVLLVTALVVVLGAGALYDVARMMEPDGGIIITADGPTTTAQPTTTATIGPPSTTSMTTAPTTSTSTTSTTSPSTTAPTTAGTTSPPTTGTTVPPVAPDPAAAVTIEAATNRLRAELALPQLAVAPDLQNYAYAHAAVMAATGTLQHGPIGNLLGKWMLVGENIGVGPDPTTVFDALVDSPDHLSVLTEPAYNHGATGAARDAAGTLWVCQIFAAPPPTAPSPTVPTPPAVTLP